MESNAVTKELIQEVWNTLGVDPSLFETESRYAKDVISEFTEKTEDNRVRYYAECKRIREAAESELERAKRDFEGEECKLQARYDSTLESLKNFSSVLETVKSTIGGHKKLVHDMHVFKETQKVIDSAKKNGTQLAPLLEDHLAELEKSLQTQLSETQTNVSNLFFVLHKRLYECKGSVGQLYGELKEAFDYYYNNECQARNMATELPCDEQCCPLDKAFECLEKGDPGQISPEMFDKYDVLIGSTIEENKV